MTAKILVVDDSNALRTTMRQILEESDLDLEVIEAGDGAQALPIALSGEIDIVLSDIVMPNLDGIGLLRGIRQQSSTATLPVILVTSQDDQGTRSTSFEVGASDYLARPFTSEELLSRIQVQLRVKSLQKELRRAVERHRRLSTLDGLTGLANRHHFIEICRKELARSRRHKLSMSIAVMDVENLRAINERVGYRSGDALLTEIAQITQHELRVDDTLARFTGGTFAALFPHTDEHQVRHVTRRICDVVASRTFPGQRTGEVTLSAGTATYPTGQLESVDELLNGAQASLDRAKARGGNRVDAWDPTALSLG